jgi:CRISPR/Cas system-associated exonuclease Cas4 (RecB family)
MTYARTRNRFDPLSEKPFRLSRSKLELFMNCPRCFYLDRRLGIGQPPSFPFNLNNAVDTLLKKEFDDYRERGLPHPLMTEFGVKAVPFRHDKMNEWRDALRGGVDYHHAESNLVLAGGIDDIWLNEREELIIVDYKATSKIDRVNIDAPWQIGYKRQLEIYAWLFQKNNFKVSKTGYFVYCNALTTAQKFSQNLNFDIVLLPYEMSSEWVDGALTKARDCLHSQDIPPYSEGCAYCGYSKALFDVQSQLSLF